MRACLFLAWFFLVFPARGADLAKDLEIVRTGMRLIEMATHEQEFRNSLDQLVGKGYSRDELMKHPDFGQRWRKLTNENTEELKRIVAKWGWPVISAFGEQGDEAAYLIMQHADQDVAFQEQCLKLVTKALGNRDTHPAYFAQLWDRVALAQGRRQRYGTQGACAAKGLWEGSPLEDAPRVNSRRRVMGLPPLEDFVRLRNEACLQSPNQ